MKKLIILAAFALAACNPDVAADGYSFDPEGRGQVYREREIKVVLHPTQRSIENAKPGQRVGLDRELFGFGIITDDKCTIHVIDPVKSYRPEQLGHELTHCLYGEWHN